MEPNKAADWNNVCVCVEQVGGRYPNERTVWSWVDDVSQQGGNWVMGAGDLLRRRVCVRGSVSLQPPPLMQTRGTAAYIPPV